MTAALAVGVLVAGGVHLVLQRSMLRVVLGFVLLGNAVNVLLVAAGGMDRRGVPLLGQVDPQQAADPLPQAFALTAVVITFGITVHLLALVGDGQRGGPDGDVPADGPDDGIDDGADDERGPR